MATQTTHATLGQHMAVFMRVARYILANGGQVSESQLFWNNDDMAEGMYGFLLDFGYLVAIPDTNHMNVRLGSLWEVKMRKTFGMPPPPPLVWSDPAHTEMLRYAYAMRFTKEQTEVFRKECENIADGNEYVGLLSVLRAETRSY